MRTRGAALACIERFDRRLDDADAASVLVATQLSDAQRDAPANPLLPPVEDLADAFEDVDAVVVMLSGKAQARHVAARVTADRVHDFSAATMAVSSQRSKAMVSVAAVAIAAFC